ncbi:MAG: PQQ-binding-like beta-propeller repeat protein, partial [Verrucomicrobiota bacterium]
VSSVAEEIPKWTDFRGPRGDGHVETPGPFPTTWSETENVAWKTPIPGRAWATPVVWGNEIWLSNATEDGKKMSVLCLDRETGKILHDEVIFTNDVVEELGNRVNGYGSCSPTIDEKSVYIHFGSYGTAAIDRKSRKVVWTRRDLPCRHYRGPGSSVVLHDELLILTMDGVDLQYLVALDRSTGETVWKTDRSTEWDDIEPDGTIQAEGDRRKAFNTPLFVKVGDQIQMISSGAKATFAYDPATGEEIWHVRHPAQHTSSSRPVVWKDWVYINTGYGKPHLIQVKLDPEARGDITATHVGWDVFQRTPKRTSPIIVDGLLYMTTDEGIFSCLDAETGEVVYSERLRGHFSGSPIYAGGNLFFCSEFGYNYLVKPGREFNIFAENKIGKDKYGPGMMASPIAVENELILRTTDAVYCIRE